MLNAIQAVPDDRVARIDIRETLSDGKVLISISDNGQGHQSRVAVTHLCAQFHYQNFRNWFGLAMCKRIVEQAEGEIWFDTTPERAPVSLVMFPLMSS